ncbi:hypothetical protein GCK72_025867 [Caenorhabditis remanei]|uniref:C2H2-type domain-containing protein n=2 Tax=Caenorhabditis remanei TaxID=31234 RepID=A0A6A5G4I5_CAERE|nr:hypothetical protein GCK72_025867 [Caenorhabditis remanei]KAF1749399.1 hypothetical protein GCK72_025867 [Caenorhabditis remanei]
MAEINTFQPRGAGHFPCRHCYKVFKYERNLHEHVYGNHPPMHYCFLCNNILPIEHKPIQLHMITIHNLPDTKTCACCDATFARKSIYDNHKKQIRSGDKVKLETAIATSIRYRDPILSIMNPKKKMEVEEQEATKTLMNKLPYKIVYSNDKIIPKSALPILAEAAVDIIQAVGFEKLGIRAKKRKIDRGPASQMRTS